MSDEKISNALGLPTLSSYNKKEDNVEIISEADIINDIDIEIIEDVEIIEEPETLPSTQTFVGDVELMNDIDKAKVNVSKMIRDGHEAFENLIVIATQTENPRAFEVASKLLTDLVNANKEMVALSEKKSNTKTLQNKSNNITNNTTNNNLVLSTADLLRILKGK